MDILQLLAAGTVAIVGTILIRSIPFCRKLLKEKLQNTHRLLPAQSEMMLDKMFDCASEVITKSAAASIGKLEQLIGKDLRKLVKDGKANKNELLALAEEAYREVLQTVSPEVMEALKKYIGNTDLYIRNVIETELLKLKSGTKS